jgi:hypothetical protein
MAQNMTEKTEFQFRPAPAKSLLNHPCCVCGEDNAPFGDGPKGRIKEIRMSAWLAGTSWYCREHNPSARSHP